MSTKVCGLPTDSVTFVAHLGPWDLTPGTECLGNKEAKQGLSLIGKSGVKRKKFFIQ